MRIERLDLERYGSFENRSLAFRPDAVLHIVYGVNEAGKTSALSAIGDLLFGFGGRTAYDFRHEARLLRLGGRLRHSDGRLVAVRRRKGNKNTLVDDDDRPLPDDLLAPLLGGVSRDSFDREFGLTAATLREGGQQLLAAGGRLAETLAAGSAGMTALSRIRERLQGEADALFTPRRSAAKPFYVALERREAADRALREAIVTREAVRQAEAAVQEARARLVALNAAHAELGGALARWQRVLRVRSPLARLDAIEAELVGLAHLPVISPQLLSEWQEAWGQHAAIDRQIAALDAADAEDAAEIAALAVDERVLLAGPEIDRLRERIGAVRKAVEDLPRRREAHDQARMTLDGLARRLGLSSHEDLLKHRRTDAALALVRELIGELRLAERAATEAESRRAQAQRDHDALAADAAAVHVADIDELRQSFEAISEVPAQAERLHRAVAAFKAGSESLGAELASLSPSPGALDRLAALPLPDAVTITEHARALEANAAELGRLESLLAAAQSGTAASEAEIAQLSGADGAPTRLDLARARHARDSRLEELATVLDGDRERRRRVFEEALRASRDVDRLTDLLLGDTERATRLEEAQQRLAAGRREHDRLSAELAAARARATALQRAWEEVWQASALTPRRPAEMLRWRERVAGVLARLREREALQIEIETLTGQLEAGRQAVVAFLRRAGGSADRDLAVDILFREARSRFHDLQTAWADARARAATRQRVAHDLDEAAGAGRAAAMVLADLRRRWPAALAGIGLPATATAAAAEAALAVWSEVPAVDVILRREQRSIEGIEADLRAFEHDVAAVAAKAAPDFVEASPQEAMARLQVMLEQARRNSGTRDGLRERAARRAVGRQSLLGRREALLPVLDAACRRLALADRGGLADGLERIAAYHRLKDEQDALRRSLLEIGDGEGEGALRREREGLDLDRLSGDIARETVRQTQLLKEIEAASVVQHQAQADLEALMAGRNAPAAAAERAAAGAELLSIAENWLLRAAAGRLAANVIERYRARVQDPLIARAGALFATATRDGFAGLGVDYNHDDQPVLIARRSDGERVPVAGLSEGTRDQLFLALRLALLERWPSEPLPFIGDDLLTSFDDVRTQAMLRLLAEAGQRKQVILFTHHRHVVDLAARLPASAVDVIAL